MASIFFNSRFRQNQLLYLSPTISLFISLPTLCLSLCLSLRLPLCLSLYVFLCVSLCIYLCLSLYLLLCLSLCLSVCLPLCLVLCLSLQGVDFCFVRNLFMSFERFNTLKSNLGSGLDYVGHFDSEEYFSSERFVWFFVKIITTF